MASGFRGRAKNVYRISKLRVEKALQHAFRGRKEKKRDWRSLCAFVQLLLALLFV